LLLHKSASSSASYDSLMPRYAAQGFACYAPDMPGFGSSFNPSDSQIAKIWAPAAQGGGTGWYVDVFMQAFADMGLDLSGKSGKVLVIGHHSGAVLAVELAARHPGFVGSICLIGPAVMTKDEREEWREKTKELFNRPTEDGSHLMKTWEYLKTMGVGEDLGTWQREFLDHARAWRGRGLIYNAVWDQESREVYGKVKCPVLLLCARDDVLWRYFEDVKGLKAEGVKAVEVGGANFELDRDAEGVEREHLRFLEEMVA
jgi:pimeloyl-ACP methyl ester carboxylesterase